MSGINYLREHRALLRIILFFSVVNFLAKAGNDGMMSAFILGRTGGSQKALGMAEAAVSLGVLAGSVVVTFVKPPKNKTKVIFISCIFTFLLGDVMLSLTPSLPYWVVSAFVSYVPVAVLGANLNTVMRVHVPLEMQGRVFSARDTLQNITIPLGLFLGGIWADHVFEPFMNRPSAIQHALALFFGAGKGSGIAVMFFIVGIIGFILSIAALRNPLYQSLNDSE